MVDIWTDDGRRWVPRLWYTFAIVVSQRYLYIGRNSNTKYSDAGYPNTRGWWHTSQAVMALASWHGRRKDGIPYWPRDPYNTHLLKANKGRSHSARAPQYWEQTTQDIAAWILQAVVAESIASMPRTEGRQHGILQAVVAVSIATPYCVWSTELSATPGTVGGYRDVGECTCVCVCVCVSKFVNLQWSRHTCTHCT